MNTFDSVRDSCRPRRQVVVPGRVRILMTCLVAPPFFLVSMRSPPRQRRCRTTQTGPPTGKTKARTRKRSTGTRWGGYPPRTSGPTVAPPRTRSPATTPEHLIRQPGPKINSPEHGRATSPVQVGHQPSWKPGQGQRRRKPNSTREPHGDVVATIDVTAHVGAAAMSSVADYDEYGIVVTATAPSPYGWVGTAVRSSANQGGLIQMGARMYNPPPDDSSPPTRYREEHPTRTHTRRTQ